MIKIPNFKCMIGRSVVVWITGQKLNASIQKRLGGCFGHWILKFVIYLKFGAWDL